MSGKSKDGKMVGSLSEYQKSLAKEYYSYQVLPNASRSAPGDRLGFILEEAQDDPVLCRHLELIDEILDDAQDSENTTSEENDKRAWAAEYLVLKAEEKINNSLNKVQAGSSERSIPFTGDFDLELSKSKPEYLVLKAEEKINDSLNKAQAGSSERSIPFTGDFDLELSKSRLPIIHITRDSINIRGMCRR